MAYAQAAILNDLIREAAHPLIGDREDYAPLLAMIGESRLVLPGEASHGVLHFDETRAVEPLERTAQWDMGQEPETFPSGM